MLYGGEAAAYPSRHAAKTAAMTPRDSQNRPDNNKKTPLCSAKAAGLRPSQNRQSQEKRMSRYFAEETKMPANRRADSASTAKSGANASGILQGNSDTFPGIRKTTQRQCEECPDLRNGSKIPPHRLTTPQARQNDGMNPLILQGDSDTRHSEKTKERRARMPR